MPRGAERRETRTPGAPAADPCAGSPGPSAPAAADRRAAPVCAGRRAARLLGLGLLAALLVAPAFAGLAAAAPAAPETLCTVRDPRLLELSGLAVDGSGGIWAMSDGGSRVALYRMDPATCAVTDTRTAPIDPFDAEDLALGPDGTFWVADTGDNNRARETVALIAVPPRGEARLYRLTYPDGPHDAEAVVVGADGVPIVVTKEISGVAGAYRPVGPLTGPGPTPLMRAGSVGFARSDTTGGPIGALGAFTVTGGATTADRSVMAVRTYTDAWLYRVPASGDLVAALQGTPVRVPLPEEPQGEAIAFTADGTLLSGSETRGLGKGQLRAVEGAAALLPAVAPATPEPPPPAAAPPEPRPEWLPAAIGGGVAVVVLGLAAGAMALHSRRRRV
ncbi:hypothetical protein GCM10009836_43350 [Pseudonocardia ailaonensis]|uniref:Esterase-like activity of phytase family protein n=1 Tax=Pseudonocardia ailaonensis TaxID=367279 RepID=A0ABN2N962_9PSEU